MPRGFIFGGDTGASYDDIQRRRAILNQLAQRSIAAAPRNVGEGISALGSGLATYLAGTALADQEKETTAAGQQAFQDLLTTLSTPQPPATASQAGGVPVGPLPSSAVSPGPGAAAAPGPPAGGAAGVTPTAGSPAGLSPRAMQLLQASANPSLNPSQRNVIGALLNRELSTSAPDPVALAQGATLVDPRTGRVIATGAQGGQKGFTLSPGQQRFGPGGQQIAAVPDAPKPVFQALTSNEKAQLGLPKEGAFQRDVSTGRISQIGGAKTNINIGQTKLSADYKPVLDEGGNIVGAEPIPGTKAAREAAAIQTKTEKGKKIREKVSDIVTTDITRALKIVEEANLPVTGAGGIGNLLASVPGTAAADLSGLLNTVKANAGFDQLQAMRAASPTGGALGSVSQMELGRLESAIGNLEQSQSKEQLLYNLNRVGRLYAETVHGTEAAAKMFQTESDGWTDIGGGVRIRRKN